MVQNAHNAMGPLMKWLISRRTCLIPDNADFQVLFFKFEVDIIE